MKAKLGCAGGPIDEYTGVVEDIQMFSTTPVFLVPEQRWAVHRHRAEQEDADEGGNGLSRNPASLTRSI